MRGTVEPLNKGVLSFVERLSSFTVSGREIWGSEVVLYLKGRGSTVLGKVVWI